MAQREKYFDVLSELIQKLFDGDITDKEFSVLKEQLSENPSAVELYVNSVVTDVVLMEYLGKYGDSSAGSLKDTSCLDSDLWKALATYENTAEAVEVEKKKLKVILDDRKLPVVPKRGLSKLAIMSLAASFIIVIMFSYMLTHPYTPTPIVATVNKTINTEWKNSIQPYDEYGELRVGDYNLIRGIAEIRMDCGADIILEAPAKFTLQSAKSVYLESGRLTAIVSEQAIGFEVCTFAGTIIDIGTEFGIEVYNNSVTDIHVLKGRTLLIAGNSADSKKTQEVTRGFAKRVEANSNEIKDITFKKNYFIKDFDDKNGDVLRDVSIDLADIVGYGNGFGTGKLSYGINMMKGIKQLFKTTPYSVGNRKYIPVNDNSNIDGVFVPDGGTSQVQISSTGLVFEQCPDTGGIFHGGIYNGAWHTRLSGKNHYFKLDGTQLKNNDSVIYIHSNQGITFDLDRIRESNPVGNIAHFSSKCGISETVLELLGQSSRAEFWVLVDGIEKFREIITPEMGSKDINIRIDGTDRFLTLVVTDAKEGNMKSPEARDWAMFVDPELVIERK